VVTPPSNIRRDGRKASVHIKGSYVGYKWQVDLELSQDETGETDPNVDKN